MQAVILAAGKGTRMRPLTEVTPKPLIPVCGQPILNYIVSALPDVITELVMVVGYKADQIRAHCGETFMGRAVTYVTQADYAGGTGDALRCAQDAVAGKFLLLNGDDIYGAEALRTIVTADHALFGVRSTTPERFGVLECRADGTLAAIIEKPDEPQSDLINIGGYVLQPEIFDFVAPKSVSFDEVLLTDMVTMYAAVYPVQVVEQDLWLPIGYPEHIAAAEKQLCPKND